MKHQQNGSSKGISTLNLAAGQQGKLMTMHLGSGGGAVFTNCSCSSPSYGNILQFGGRTPQGIVETADSSYVQAKLASL